MPPKITELPSRKKREKVRMKKDGG